MMKIRVRVRLTSRAEQPLPLATPHVGHVLDEMRDALLVFSLISTSSEDLEVRLEPSRGARVRQDDVLEAVLQRALAEGRMCG